MIVFRLAWHELTRFRGRLNRLVPVALLLIPTLYGALYLWSNWDPYGKLDQVPVAVASSDQPVTANGRTVNAGDMFIQQLRHNHDFGWKFTDEQTARAGVKTGKYEFAVIVPADFSKDLVSPATGNPQRANVIMLLNDANGYIVGKMAQTAQLALQQQIDSAAYAAYTNAILNGLGDLKASLDTAGAGAAQLAAGAGSAQTGANTLSTGLTQLKAGSDQVASGATQVAAGAAQLAQVINNVGQIATTRLPDLAKDLASGANSIDGLVGVVSQGTARAATDTAAAAQAIRALAISHPELAADPAYQQTVANADALAQNAAQVNAAQQQVQAAADRAAATAQRVQADVAALAGQIGAGSSQVQQLANAAGQVAGGAAQLQAGIATAQPGAAQLATGTGQLATGAGGLASSLQSGAGRVPTLDASAREQLARVLSSPTDVEISNLNPAKVYGRGLAPFFFAIALWVFGLIVYQFIRPVNGRALVSRLSSGAIAVSGWLPALGLGVVGGLLLYLVTVIGLGLSPVQFFGTALLIILATAVFTAIAYVLKLALGLVGSFITLVLLMLQLTSCGGLYPVQTLPLPFRLLHPLLPMTYLVDGLRVTISGGLMSHLLADAFVLLVFALLAIGGAVLVTWRRRTMTVAQLKSDLPD